MPAEEKIPKVVFDPQAPEFRRKLWVVVTTPQGRQLIVIWRRLLALVLVLTLAAWLGLATSVWGFVRYGRAVDGLRWPDVAFYPLRRAEYRGALGRHQLARGQRELGAQRWTEGLMSLRAALAYAPELLEARRILAEFLLKSRQPDAALQLLEAGLPYAGGDAGYVNGFLRLCRDEAQPERIVRSAGSILPPQPDALDAHRLTALRVAEAQLQLGRTEACGRLIKDWQLETTVEGQVLIADWLVARREVDQALVRLETLLAQAPAEELVAVKLTRLYLDQHRYGDARRVALLRSIARPDSPGAQIDVMNLDQKLGHWTDFVREADDFIAKFGRDHQALLFLVNTAAEQGNVALALRLCAQARQAGFDLEPYRLGLMRAQCGAARYADALATARELEAGAGGGERTGAVLSAYKCWAFFGSGNREEGEAALQRFITQEGLPVGVALALAQDLDALSFPGAAARVLEAAANERGSGDAPLRALAELAVRQGEWLKAKKLLPRLQALAAPPADLIRTIEANAVRIGL